jgi:hypothetical protein
VTWDLALGCLAAGLVIAALTTPVGVSGRGNIAPDWPVGLLCGLGGLADGYLGAMLQPLVPEGRLRQLLGTCAAGICGAERNASVLRPRPAPSHRWSSWLPVLTPRGSGRRRRRRPTEARPQLVGYRPVLKSWRPGQADKLG